MEELNMCVWAVHVCMFWIFVFLWCPWRWCVFDGFSCLRCFLAALAIVIVIVAAGAIVVVVFDRISLKMEQNT